MYSRISISAAAYGRIRTYAAISLQCPGSSPSTPTPIQRFVFQIRPCDGSRKREKVVCCASSKATRKGGYTWRAERGRRRGGTKERRTKEKSTKKKEGEMGKGKERKRTSECVSIDPIQTVDGHILAQHTARTHSPTYSWRCTIEHD